MKCKSNSDKKKKIAKATIFFSFLTYVFYKRNWNKKKIPKMNKIKAYPRQLKRELHEFGPSMKEGLEQKSNPCKSSNLKWDNLYTNVKECFFNLS